MSAKNYIPKEGTQQSLFLEKYPEFDGRGIKIAIIDSDVVDASLPGFQKTSTGLPKITEIFPRTGITVNTSTIVESSESKDITGLSGRKIKISSGWKNPSHHWHIGSIPVKDIMNMEVLTDFDFIKLDTSDANKMNKNEFEDEIADCIVWFDGEKWRAFIDNSLVSDNSNSENAKALTNFNDEHEVAHFLNDIIYYVNISDDGNMLEIFCPLHYHGTTVSQVAAGYFPDDPEGSGLAPGAQIVSLNFGNHEESLQKCIECKADIVNLSFCFNDKIDNTVIKRIIKKMVEECGIIIIQAAAYFGPFYSSMHFHRMTSIEEAFLIGSVYSSEEIRKFNYSKKKKGVPKYSSKGPLASGARGIDFVAPGAAIVNLPKWYPIKNKYQQGTSLAAPNVTGSIACLLSALKANKIPYSPAMIKMALANTAFLPEGGDRLTFGHGIIQIYDAFEFIKKFCSNLPMKSLSPIFLNDPKQKGILHIRDRNDKNTSQNYNIYIEPEFNMQWILKCTPTVNNFVTKFKIVKDNLINVKIDPSLLEEGSINYAEIHGIDSLNPSIGPLFYLPITIICPADPSCFNRNITLKPGRTAHLFFKSPSESQQCCVKITLLENEKERKLILIHQQKSGDIKDQDIFKFTSKEKVKNSLLKVVKDETLFELCFYHRHSSTVHFNFCIDFQKSNL